MEILQSLLIKAKPWHKRILLISDDSYQFYSGVKSILDKRIGKPIVLGHTEAILQSLKDYGVSDKQIEIIDIEHDFRVIEAFKYCNNILLEDLVGGIYSDMFWDVYTNIIGLALVKTGVADVFIGLPQFSIKDFVLIAKSIIGTKYIKGLISSSHLVQTTTMEYGVNGILMFGDCSIVENPTSKELADITNSTALLASLIFGDNKPKVSLLSFSTKGSASHHMVDKVIKAGKIIDSTSKTYDYDYELQLDASIDPQIGSRKAPFSFVAGYANVLIFPDLQAGNIGLSLVNLFGDAITVGPIIHGLSLPTYQLPNKYTCADILYLSAVGVIATTMVD